MPDPSIEATLRRDRGVVLASLAGVVALAWFYLWRGHAGMDMSAMSHPAGAAKIPLDLLMWTIMMIGMMLPSAAPMVLFYGAMVRKNGERGTVLPSVWTFTSGYLAAWIAFSLGAAVLQAVLEHAMLLTPMLASARNDLSAGVLIAAGIYQWSPLKQACLSKCRHPVQFFTMRWRAGSLGAFRMGLEHGLYCIGCCWMLMLLLFVAGVMNLLWVALIAAFVFVEKLLPGERYTSRIASLVLICAGVFLAIR